MYIYISLYTLTYNIYINIYTYRKQLLLCDSETMEHGSIVNNMKKSYKKDNKTKNKTNLDPLSHPQISQDQTTTITQQDFYTRQYIKSQPGFKLGKGDENGLNVEGVSTYIHIHIHTLIPHWPTKNTNLTVKSKTQNTVKKLIWGFFL